MATDKSFAREWIEILIWATVIALLARTFVAQPYKIPSASMEDTLMSGDYVVVEKISKLTHEFQIGEVVAFEYPDDPSKDFVKRIVAKGGQTVEIRNKELFVDAKPVEMPAKGKHIDATVFPAEYNPRDNYGPVLVPQDQFFMMGDNRDNALDSRFWRTHFVDKRLVKGRAFIIYWSLAEDKGAPQGSLLNPITLVQSIIYNAMHIMDRGRFDRIGTTVQ